MWDLKKMQSATVSIFSPFICHEEIGLDVMILSSIPLLSCVQLFAAPWIFLTITNSQSLLKFMLESVMPSNHLILFCHPLLLLPSFFPSIRVFSKESVLCIRWPKYWSFSFRISPFKEYSSWFPLGWTGWISLKSKFHTTVQKHKFFSAQLSL